MKYESKQSVITRISSVCGRLYNISTLVALMAVYLAILSPRPDWLHGLDKLIGQRIANEQQLQSINSQIPLNLKYVASSLDFSDPASVFSIFQNSNSITPAWFGVLEPALLIAATVLICFGLKRLSAKVALQVVVASVITLGLAQGSALYFLDIWLPMGITIQFVGAAYLLMLLQLGLQRQIQQLRLQLHRTAILHAHTLFEHGEPEQAFHALGQCLPVKETAELAYALGSELERKRQYQSAIEAYGYAVQYDKNFREAKERMADLIAAQKRQVAIKASAHTPMPLEATMVVEQNVPLPCLGRYEVKRELGRGAMGTVYLGVDPKISREVAIKTLSYHQFDDAQLEELRERFFREAKAAGRLNHPNIVTVYDVGEESDLAYIAMDYICGISMEAHCRKDMLLPVEAVYQVILQVAEALSYAHKQKIIHRDIKPSNLIYSAQSEQVKVSDFGIARMTDESKTRTGHVMGSPLYMSPEQLKGRAVTGAADIFSLGATMYQLLTGSTPFVAENLPELTIKIMSKKHKSVRDLRSDLPASAVRITNKALHKDPAKRFKTADEMAEQLRKALANDFKARVA